MKTLWPSIFYFLTYALTGFLVSCATGSKDKELAYNHFKIGVTMLAQDKKEAALEQLIKARDLDPENALFHNHLGLAYFFLNENEHAILSLKEAISKNPNYSEAHNNLGRVYIEVRDFIQARNHLSLAARDLTYTSKDKVWLNLGLSYYFEGLHQKSQNYFVKSISFNRDNCLAYNYYGRSLLDADQFQKASKALDQAIYHCRKKGFDEPHYYGAIALYRLGYTARALARLQEGRKLFPRGENKLKMDEMINLLRVTDTK